MFIEEFYFGNIEPQEITTPLKLTIKKKLNTLTQTEEHLSSQLTEEEKRLFDKYVNQYNEFLSVCSSDGFIAGFRLGAKFTYDTFVAD